MKTSRNAIVVSPHLDDAVLSAGVSIQDLSASHCVFVATVFTEGASLPHSALANTFSGARKDAAAEMAVRRAEDWRALSLLKAIPIHMGYRDAPFRTDSEGRPICETKEDIVLRDISSDFALIAELVDRISLILQITEPSILLTPCAIGNHLDHRVVRAAVDLVLARPVVPKQLLVAYYEDLPYACEEEFIRRPTIPRDLNAQLVVGSDDQWKAKVAAIRCYSSQLGYLDVDGIPVTAAIEDYGRALSDKGVAERRWLL